MNTSMNSGYAEKTAARRLAELTGHPYQRCLAAVRDRNLEPLVPNPKQAHPADVVDVAALAVTDAPTVSAARAGLVQDTVAAVVRAHHGDAVEAVVEMDEEEPHVGYLALVIFADGEELEGTWGEPVADAAFVWAQLLAAELRLPPGECHSIPLG